MTHAALAESGDPRRNKRWPISSPARPASSAVPRRQSPEARRADLRAGAQGLARRSSTRCATHGASTTSDVIAVVGDLAKPKLGVADADLRKLKGKVDHFFHLAAIYDLKATRRGRSRPPTSTARATPSSSRRRSTPGCFHHVSSIAAAGLYDGVFREDMFEEAEELDHPYFKTKHDSEGVVRDECKRPFRIYRPGFVVGDSKTGLHRQDRRAVLLLQVASRRCASILPPWMPMIGIEGGRINIVPVDFVADALDYLAHKKGLDGKCFHLTDPEPHRIGEVLNIFAKAAHAPQMTMRINAKMFGFIPAPILYGLGSLAPVKRMVRAVLNDLGIPKDVFQFVNWPTRYDNREAAKALKGSGIAVPQLEIYAAKLWDYWERNLDPDLFIDRSLAGRVRGQGGRRHRRVVGHRPGDGAQARRGGREGDPGRARRGEARSRRKQEIDAAGGTCWIVHGRRLRPGVMRRAGRSAC